MNRIRELREEKRITQIRLSIELGVSQEAVSAYELEKNYPSIQSLIKMRGIFNANIDYILGLSNTRHDPIYTGTLSDSERTLVLTYHQMDTRGKERALAYMQGYLDALKDKKN